MRCRGDTLFAGQSCLSRRVAVSGNPARAAKSRGRGDAERCLRSRGRDVHGCCDYGFYLWLRQRTDSFWRAGLLCDGTRSVVFPKSRDHKSLSCASGGFGGAGNLDCVSNVAAHGDNQHRDTRSDLRKRLQSTARIHHLGGFALLRSDGCCGNAFET